MFKFRRRSLCSSKEIFSPRANEDSVSKLLSTSHKNGGKDEDKSGIGNSTDLQNSSKGQSEKCPSSNQLSTRSRSEEKESKVPVRSWSSVSTDRRNSCGVEGKDSADSPVMTNKWTFNGEKLKANFKKSFIGQVMCDRKRKERHESTNQGQEKKVIRSQSDDEKGSDSETVNEFKRTLSHDDFNKKKTEQEFLRNEKITEKQEPKTKADTSVPLTNIAIPARSFAIGNYEPELQRQLERSVNYNNFSANSSKSLNSKKPHHRRRHRSPRHVASQQQDEDFEEQDFADESGPTSLSSLIEIEGNENNDSRTENESPISESSSSSDSSGSSSTDDSPTQTAIPLVKIEDLSSASGDETLDGKDKAQPIPRLSFLDSIRGPVADDHVMLSPRSGFLSKEATMDLPPSPPMHQIQVDPPQSRQSLLGENESTKIISLTRHLTNLKKTLKDMEEDYELIFGYRPSHADKLNHKEMKKCLMQLAKAKKDLKQRKEEPSAALQSNLVTNQRNIANVSHERGTAEYLKSLEDTVKEIQVSLDVQRKKLGRQDDPDKMTNSQITEEKSLMQRQLLFLERKLGRPSSKQEKDIVRPLYDRYRAVKKFGLGPKGASLIKEPTLDLVPIIEHVTLELPEPEDDGQNSGTETSNLCSVVEIRKDHGSPILKDMQLQDIDTNMELGDEEQLGLGGNESFNQMTLHELEKRQQQEKDTKRRIRSLLRRFESDFQDATGRPPFKEEKYTTANMESYYQRYKRTRATIRLLDVLITKKKFPQLMVVDINKSED